MNFPSSISEQPAFLTSTFIEAIASDRERRILSLPDRLAADGDFSEEAAALQLIGHIARCAATQIVDRIDIRPPDVLTRSTDYWQTAPWYAALRTLQYPHASELDPRRAQSKLRLVADVDARLVQQSLVEKGASFIRPSGAKQAYVVALGSGIESRPTLLHDGKNEPSALAKRLGVAAEKDIKHGLKRGLAAIGATELISNLSSSTVSIEWFLRTFAHLASELYLNAVEHGTKSETGRFLPRSLRGFIVRLSNLDLSRLVGQDAFTAMMSPFFGRCRDRVIRKQKLLGLGASAVATIPLLEFSFVDNGPGFVRTWLAAEEQKTSGRLREVDISSVTPKQECDIIQACFEKHRTTKTNDEAGVGLYDVHKLMRRVGGLIIVRTSQVRVVRDYSRSILLDKSAPDFENWDPKNERLPEICGAAVTVLVPLVPLPNIAEE